MTMWLMMLAMGMEKVVVHCHNRFTPIPRPSGTHTVLARRFGYTSTFKAPLA